LQIRELASDLTISPFLPTKISRRRRKVWTPEFFSKHFLSENDELELGDFVLP